MSNTFKGKVGKGKKLRMNGLTGHGSHGHKKVAERQPKMPPNSRPRPCFQSEASCVSRFHRPH